MRFSFLRNTASVSAATLISRIGGFIRDVLLAQLLGAQAAADIFVVAFRLPNMFRRLFAEGAFSAAFVPLLSERYSEGNAESGVQNSAAQDFAAQILSGFSLLLFLVVIIAEIFMPQIIALIAPGFITRFAAAPLELEAIIFYARLAFPYLFFVGLMAYFAACLNVAGKFAVAALAPVLLNIILIIAIGLALFNGAGASVLQKNNALDYIIYAVLVAGVAQVLPVWWAARRCGWRVGLVLPRWGATQKKFLKLLAPALLSSGVVQINMLVGTAIATAQAGAAAWLYYADRLYQLPLALIGVALSVVLLPDLAKRLATMSATELRIYIDRIWAATASISLAAAAGLFVLSEPATRLLFEGGAFSAADSAAVARAVQIFCFGLPAFILLRPAQAIFFAHLDTRAPFIDGLISVIVNITLSLLLFPIYGFIAIAFATSVAGWVNLLLLLLRLRRRAVWHVSLGMAGRLARLALAAGAMAALVYGLCLFFFPHEILSTIIDGGIYMRIVSLITLIFIILLGTVFFAVLVFYRVLVKTMLKINNDQ